MVQSLELRPSPGTAGHQNRQINKLPLVAAAVLTLIVLAVIVGGLSWRGAIGNRAREIEGASDAPATSFADRLKRGISDGIIAEPDERQDIDLSPAQEPAVSQPPDASQRSDRDDAPSPQIRDEPRDNWRESLKREQEEQYLRERHRQQMARLQASSVALDSPLKVEVATAEQGYANRTSRDPTSRDATSRELSGTTALSPLVDRSMRQLQSGLLAGQGDNNGQWAKEDFFNQDLKELGYLAKTVTAPISPYELKRGAVIPATLITGLNSDLPGRIIAQVSQDVYDTRSGDYVLIPQGAKLFGRYDSKVSFGQSRALVIWTDLVFPNGAALQLGGMAGTDSAGYGGFEDKVDRHYLRTFGAAALIAIIGTGIDASVPESSTRANQDTASDAARRNFAESFGRVAEQTISKNLNVQPTVRIRPGYRFNVLVDQDIVFPAPYSD